MNCCPCGVCKCFDECNSTCEERKEWDLKQKGEVEGEKDIPESKVC